MKNHGQKHTVISFFVIVTLFLSFVPSAWAAPGIWSNGSLSGSGWLDLGGTDDSVFAIAASGGAMYAGGAFGKAGSCTYDQGCLFVAKWDGTTWSPLGTGTNEWVESIATAGNDVYVGGELFTQAGNCTSGCNNIAKWDGSKWAALGTGVAGGGVYAIAVIGNEVYAGGDFFSAGNCTSGCNYIAKWDGSTWTALGTGTNGSVNAIAINASDVYAGGGFGIAKWNGSAWSALGSGVSGGNVNAITVSDGIVYVGGSFTSAGDCASGCSGIARWDGSQWTALGSGVAGGGVNAIAIVGNDVYAGGDFSSAGKCTSGCEALARWNGSTWTSLEGGGSHINAMAASGNTVYMGGGFFKGCPACENIAVYDSDRDANLSSLELSNGRLTPAFSFDTTTYTAALNVSVDHLVVTPTALTENATIEVRINGGPWSMVPSGSPSIPLALIAGNNTIEVRVTSVDTSNSKTYTVTVSHPVSLPCVSPASPTTTEVPDGDVAALIAALNLANTHCGDTINLAKNGLYTLTSANNQDDGANGLPSLTSRMTINGNGATIERSAAAADFRILHIATTGQLTLSNLTIQNGSLFGAYGAQGMAGIGHTGQPCTPGANNNGADGGNGGIGKNGKGGGLYNSGSLQAHHLILQNNTAAGGAGGAGGRGGGGADASVETNGHVDCIGGDGGSGGAATVGGQGQGGGLFNAESGLAILTHSTLSANQARGGWGNDGGDGGDGGSTSLHASISGYGGAGGEGGSGNGGYGAAVYNAGQLVITSSILTNNTIVNSLAGDGGSGGSGGAVGGDGGYGGSGWLFGGGAIYNDGALSLDASLIQNNAAGNGRAGGNGGNSSYRTANGYIYIYKGGNGGDGGEGNFGGAIYTSDKTQFISITNSIISGNLGASGGTGGTAGAGGVPSNGNAGSDGSASGIYNEGAPLNLVHTTLAANTGGDGGGIVLTGTSALSASNTIIVGQTVGIKASGSVVLDSTLWGSDGWANGTNWTGSVTHTHDYTGDPDFVNPARGDYHIGAGSAAIDKGIVTAVTVDIDNQPRPNPNTGIPDLGADEYWVLVPLTSVQVQAPSAVLINHPVQVTAVVIPANSTPNLTFTWSPEPVSGQNTPTATYSYSSQGPKTITVSVENAGGSVNNTITLLPVYQIYLPNVRK